MNESGKLLVISGPSGAGKSTVISKVMAAAPNIVFSVSATTRSPRAGEKDGSDYFFITKPQFEEMVQTGQLLEYASYVENCYGTPKKPVLDNLEQGRDVLFDIEVQGAMQIKSAYPQAILIFLVPSCFDEIERRLRHRGTDSDEKIARRVETARREYRFVDNYDYIVLNDDPDVAAGEIKAILTAEKCRLAERKKYVAEVCSL